MMGYESHDLPQHAEPITVQALRVGSVYFSVTYADDEMLIPLVQTLVFIGHDPESGNSETIYFQDVESFRAGVKFNATKGDSDATFIACAPTQLNAVFELNKALDELIRRAMRPGNRPAP